LAERSAKVPLMNYMTVMMPVEPYIYYDHLRKENGFSPEMGVMREKTAGKMP